MAGSVAPNLNPAGKAALVVTPCAKRISVVNFNDMQLCSDGVPPPELQTRFAKISNQREIPLLGLAGQLLIMVFAPAPIWQSVSNVTCVIVIVNYCEPSFEALASTLLGYSCELARKIISTQATIYISN